MRRRSSRSALDDTDANGWSAPASAGASISFATVRFELDGNVATFVVDDFSVEAIDPSILL